MNNKAKNIALVSGFLLAILLCYKLALNKTINLKQEYNQLKNQEVLFKNTPRQLSLLKQKQKYYDSILTKHKISGNSIQNNLLEVINRYANNSKIKVITFLKPHVIIQNNLKVNTYQFTLQGDYNALIKLIYKLEQETKFGEIINLHFEKKKNYRTNKHYLEVHVLLRSFG